MLLLEIRSCDNSLAQLDDEVVYNWLLIKTSSVSRVVKVMLTDCFRLFDHSRLL